MSSQSRDSLSPDLEAHASAPKRGSERSFGLVFAVFFGAVGLWPLWKGGDPRLVFCAIAAMFALIGWLRPVLLAWPNRAWLWLGDMMGKIVGPVALAVVFLLTIVPTGLVMRLFGKDPLKLKWDRDAGTYWVERSPRTRGGEGMRNQF